MPRGFDMSRALCLSARLLTALIASLLLPAALAHAQSADPAPGPRLAQPLQQGV
jgi:hypothetical protein